MQDWVKKLFTEPSTLGIIVSSAVVGVVAGVAQGVVEKRHGGWGGFVRAVLTGTAVAVIVGLGIEDFIASETARLAIVGACAVISEDIWAGLKAMGSAMRRDPLGFVARVIDAVRGRGQATRKPGPAEPPANDDRGRP